VLDRSWVRLSEPFSHLTVSRGRQANLEHLHGEKGLGNKFLAIIYWIPFRFKDETRRDISYGYLKNAKIITAWPNFMSIQVSLWTYPQTLTLLNDIFSSMHLKNDFLSGDSNYSVNMRYHLSFDLWNQDLVLPMFWIIVWLLISITAFYVSKS